MSVDQWEPFFEGLGFEGRRSERESKSEELGNGKRVMSND